MAREKLQVEYHESIDTEDSASTNLIIESTTQGIIDAYTIPNNWSRIKLGQYFNDRGNKKGRSSVGHSPLTPLVISSNSGKMDFDENDEFFRKRVATTMFRVHENVYDDNGLKTIQKVEYHLWFRAYKGSSKSYSKWASRIVENIFEDAPETISNQFPMGMTDLELLILHPTYDLGEGKSVIANLVSSYYTQPADAESLFPGSLPRTDGMKKYRQQKTIKERTDINDPNSEIRIISAKIPMREVYEKLRAGSTIGKKWECPKCRKETLKYFNDTNKVKCFPDDGGCGFHGDSIQLVNVVKGFDPIKTFNWFHCNFIVQNYDIESDYDIDRDEDCKELREVTKEEVPPEEQSTGDQESYPWD